MNRPGPRSSPASRRQGGGRLAEFLALARSRLHQQPPPGLEDRGFETFQGDHSFSPGLAPDFLGRAGKPAAVLIAVVDRPDQPTLLLTRRSTALRNHSGQIAFPGGRIDAGDADPLAAALREACEEIGLEASRFRLLGYGDLYLTNSGYRVVPVVGLIEPGFALSLNPAEVDAVFECPLAFLMDPANHRRESREWRGAVRSYYAMTFGEHYIWGVTAGILRNLYERVYA